MFGKETDRKTGNKMRIRIQVRELAVFAMFAALMVASKIAMEALPNIHLLGMFTMLLTLLYRGKALIPIYLYAGLLGLLYGFDPTWWPIHLYVWTVLWGMTMLLPKNLPERWARLVYPVVCALHGLLYGAMTAPYCLLTFPLYGGLNARNFLAYVAAGIPFDIAQALGNLAFGCGILPLLKLLRRIGGVYFRENP